MPSDVHIAHDLQIARTQLHTSGPQDAGPRACNFLGFQIVIRRYAQVVGSARARRASLLLCVLCTVTLMIQQAEQP